MSEQDVRKHLLECAKQEFLAHGFQGASLRRTCAGAGVTTGAVYFFFQNKEDMFAQIVANTAAELTNLGQALSMAELEEPDSGPDCVLRLMEFLYRHRNEALHLLK